MINSNLFPNLEKKINVEDRPFPFSTAKNFLPLDIVLKAENDINKFSESFDDGNKRYQKLKRAFADYKSMPGSVKNIIDIFYSTEFIRILEKKLNGRGR